MNKPDITIEELHFKVIYIRFRGTYLEFRKKSRSMFNALFKFASEHHLVDEGFTKVLTLYHDNPYITDKEDLRTSVAMTVPLNSVIQEEGEISVLEFSGKYAVLHFDLKLNEYDKAWNYAYHEWLFKHPEYTPRDDFPFVMYVNEPPRNLKSSSLTNIYIPIE